MLSNYSIQKMQQSQYQSKVRVYNNQQRKLEQRQNIMIFKYDNSRNLNRVSFNNSESPLHNYSKFVVGMVLKQNKIDFVTEFKLSSGKEVDIFDIDNQIFIEVQKANFEKKLSNYQRELDLGIVNDIFIIPLDDFIGNLNEDLVMIKEKLGI